MTIWDARAVRRMNWRQWAVMGKKLTVGKPPEAIALDHTAHLEERLAASQEAT